VQRFTNNKSANRYNSGKKKNAPNQSLILARREKTMIRDRLHILDRMSNSLNSDDGRSVSDFSDAKSLKNRKLKKKQIHDPYMLVVKPPKSNQVIIDLKNKLNPRITRNDTVSNKVKTKPAKIHQKELTSDEDMQDSFAQYQNIDINSREDLAYLSRCMCRLPTLSRSITKVVKNSHHATYSPSSTSEPKLPFNELRTRNVVKNLKKINKKLDPKFKLAKVDIEELQSSQTLQLGDWGRAASPEMVINMMKEERRREYWKRRIKATNPKGNKSMDAS
jgi:hypothetical protein